MTIQERRELRSLGKERCPCFCSGHRSLEELMEMDTAPNRDPWADWLEKPHVQDFVYRFFPDFCAKMIRFVELYRMRQAEQTPKEITQGQIRLGL